MVLHHHNIKSSLALQALDLNYPEDKPFMITERSRDEASWCLKLEKDVDDECDGDINGCKVRDLL